MEEEHKSAAETVTRVDKKHTRVSYPWKALVFVMGNAMGQSFANVGLTAVLELFFAQFLFVCYHNATSLASSAVNVFLAIVQVCGLSGGLLADKVIGNFATQVIGNVLGTCGLLLTLFASWQYTLDLPHCCQSRHNSSANHSDWGFPLATPTQGPDCTALHNHVVLQSWNLHLPPTLNLALAVSGLVVYAISYGHVNSIQSVFVGDQFSSESDQDKAKQRSFSWFYLWSNVGNIAGEAGLPIMRQTAGFAYTLFVITGVSVLSTVWLWLGSCFYTLKRPRWKWCAVCRRDSPRTAACCQGSQETSNDSAHSETDPLLGDAEKEEAVSAAVRNRWQVFTSKLKPLLPILGVFLPIIVFWAIMYQQNSTWVVQGLEMNCYIGTIQVPPDLMPSVNDTMVVIIIPVTDYIVVPHLERAWRMRVKPIHKLVVGMSVAGLSFLFAGMLQLYLTHPGEDCRGRVHLAWQLPQFFLISIGEVLVAVTGLEFAYSQAPPSYRNLVTALWSFCQAVGTLINAGVAQVPIPEEYRFFAYAVAMTIVIGIFLLINRNYRYRGDSSPHPAVNSYNGTSEHGQDTHEPAINNVTMAT